MRSMNGYGIGIRTDLVRYKGVFIEEDVFVRICLFGKLIAVFDCNYFHDMVIC